MGYNPEKQLLILQKKVRHYHYDRIVVAKQCLQQANFVQLLYS